jgi:DNA-binding NarL/FixJ family response regulator
MDVEMPKMDGLKTVKYIKIHYPAIKVIMLSNRIEAWIIQKALKSGASGYVTKYSESHEVIDAITKVSRGETYFCKNSFDVMMKQISGKVPTVTNNMAQDYKNLTSREREVLKLIGELKTTKDMADSLSISARTVETHRRNILRKLGYKNSLELIKEVAGKDIKDIVKEPNI